MKTAEIKEKLHRFIETVEEKRMKAIYSLFEHEIEQEEWEYTDEFKTELDRRYAHYANGGAMISAAEADKHIKAVVKKIKGK